MNHYTVKLTVWWNNFCGHCLGDIQENHSVRTLSKDLGKMRYNKGEPWKFKGDQFQTMVRCWADGRHLWVELSSLGQWGWLDMFEQWTHLAEPELIDFMQGIPEQLSGLKKNEVRNFDLAISVIQQERKFKALLSLQNSWKKRKWNNKGYQTAVRKEVAWGIALLLMMWEKRCSGSEKSKSQEKARFWGKAYGKEQWFSPRTIHS